MPSVDPKVQPVVDAILAVSTCHGTRCTTLPKSGCGNADSILRANAVMAPSASEHDELRKQLEQLIGLNAPATLGNFVSQLWIGNSVALRALGDALDRAAQPNPAIVEPAWLDDANKRKRAILALSLLMDQGLENP